MFNFSIRSARYIFWLGLVAALLVGTSGLGCGDDRVSTNGDTNSSDDDNGDVGNGDDAGNGDDDAGDDDDDSIAGLDAAERDALCDDIDDQRLTYDVDAIERANCKVAAFTAAQENWPGEDPYETCDDIFGACIDDVEEPTYMDCPVADIDEDSLSDCDAEPDALLECMAERFEGAEQLAPIATCDEDTLGSTGRVEDEDVMEAGQLMMGEGERCEELFEDCPGLDPN